MKRNKSSNLIVLGMHRSGTSCITRIFNLNGVNLGNDLLEPQRDNPLGFWENWYLVYINRQILKNSNGSWDKPPKQIKLSLKNKLDILSFINNRNSNEVFGLKDPRMILTWKAWEPYLNNSNIVAVFRHPASVTKSLYARNNLDYESSSYLWNTYNQILLDINKKYNITFINFDNSLSFEKKIKDVLVSIGLNYNSETLKYYDSSNRKSDDKKTINKKNIDIYNQLLNNE
tara:strand:- start:164 stop:853 length:690 start_codon:yes stop_codon:yes gene_type:complete